MSKNKGVYKNNYDEFGVVFDDLRKRKGYDDGDDDDGEYSASDRESEAGFSDYGGSNSSLDIEAMEEELSGDVEIINGFKEIHKKLKKEHFITNPEDESIKELLHISTNVVNKKQKKDGKMRMINASEPESLYTTEDHDKKIRNEIARILGKKPIEPENEVKEEKMDICKRPVRQLRFNKYVVVNPQIPGFYSCMPSDIACLIFPYHLGIRDQSHMTNIARILIASTNPLTCFVLKTINESVRQLVKAKVSENPLPREQFTKHLRIIYQAAIIVYILDKKNLKPAKYFIITEYNMVMSMNLSTEKFNIIKNMDFLLVNVLTSKQK